MMWLFLLLPVFVFCLCAYYFRAFRFLREQEAGGAPKPVFPVEKVIPEAGLAVQVFAHARAKATLILVPGLHPRGIYDPRAQTLARSCARAGFQVVAADLPEFRTFHITNKSITAIVSLIEALPEHFPESSLRNVGVLGISYGFGPAVLAAACPSIRERVSFLISIGGYYQLQHALEFALTGIHSHDGFRQVSKPQPWARMIFAMNHLEELGLGASDSNVLREAFLLRLNENEQAARKVETELSPGGKVFLETVLAGMTPETLGAFGPLLLQLEPELSKLSPASALSGLKPDLRFYLLHGRSDDLVPCVETRELEQALRERGCQFVRALVTDRLGHVDMSRASSIFDLLRLLRWTRFVLSETYS